MSDDGIGEDSKDSDIDSLFSRLELQELNPNALDENVTEPGAPTTASHGRRTIPQRRDEPDVLVPHFPSFFDILRTLESLPDARQHETVDMDLVPDLMAHILEVAVKRQVKQELGIFDEKISIHTASESYEEGVSHSIGEARPRIHLLCLDFVPLITTEDETSD